MRFRTLVAEAWRSLAANASTTIAATMTVLIAMFILGLSVGLGTWALSWSNHVKKELVVHVYFCTTLSCGRAATQAQETEVGNMLGNISEVKSVNFVSKAQAFKLMQKKNPELTNGLPSNPLPDSFEVIPQNGNDIVKIAATMLITYVWHYVTARLIYDLVVVACGAIVASSIRRRRRRR